jgi:hypothetical protein
MTRTRAPFNICVTARDEIQKSPNGLRNDFDGINRDGALRRDLVATLHLLRDGMTSFLVEVLGYRQAGDQHIDVINLGQQEACVKKRLVGRAGWVVGMKRSTPHFCPVGCYAGNEGLPVHLHMQKIILGFPVKTRTEAISRRRPGRAQQCFRRRAFFAVGELQIGIPDVNTKNVQVDLLSTARAQSFKSHNRVATQCTASRLSENNRRNFDG